MPKVLSSEQARARLKGARGWRVAGGRIKRVQKRFVLQDFVRALRFVNKVGRLAEAHGHHPDIVINYSRVTLRLSTHSAGGITDMDVKLAKAIDGAAPKRR